MAKDTLYTGIDIGSSAVRVVMGQHIDGRMRIISASDAPTEGVSKGVVTSIEDVVSSVSAAVEHAERIGGVQIEKALISVNGGQIIAQKARGVVAVAKADREITQDDVSRALESAQSMSNQPNHEVLHVLPKSFAVDNQTGIKDPVGMTGLRLEVEAQIILAPQNQISHLTKAVYRTGVDIDDMVLGPLAAAEAVLTKRQRDLGVALVVIGSVTTSLAVIEEGELLHISVLPVGSSHITNDIAIGLRTSIDIAEELKQRVGSAAPEQISAEEELDLKEFGQAESEVVNLRYVAEIIQARVDEICRIVDKKLKSIDRSGSLPAGVVLTGGGARLQGLVEVGKDVFRLPTSIGIPKIETMIDRVQDPAFSTAVGLVLWGVGVERSHQVFQNNRYSSVAQVTGKMRGWFRSLIP
jgi:cell division protein FtsA